VAAVSRYRKDGWRTSGPSAKRIDGWRIDRKPRDLPLGWTRVSNGAVSVDGWVVLRETPELPEGSPSFTVRTAHGKKLTHEVNFNGATYDTVEHFASVEAAIATADRIRKRG
jgi:hypothetical protein